MLFSLRQFIGHLAKILLVALGEVTGSGESDGIGDLCDGLVTLCKHLLGTLESRVANQFDRRIVGQGLGLAVELGTAHANLITELFDTEVRVGEVLLDDAAHLGEELVVEGGGSEGG